MTDQTVDHVVAKMYGPTRDERMDEIRAEVECIMNDRNQCTASGKRAMVPMELLRKLLANDPDAS